MSQSIASICTCLACLPLWFESLIVVIVKIFFGQKTIGHILEWTCDMSEEGESWHNLLCLEVLGHNNIT